MSATPERLHGLAPILDAGTRLIVLGSFPSRASLQAQRYYAHPQNQFWKILGALWGLPLQDMNYQERTDALRAHGLGVWDVYASCEREGSLDSAIRNEQGNDFAALLQEYPGIRAIYFNGGKSAQAFKRYNKALLARPDIAFHAMPSTSPANARWRLPMLEETWRKALTESGILCYTENKN